MINFLSHKLQPAVHCDAIDDDFHPIDNLISHNQRALDSGFMAYSVTKPPVEIVFNLYCPITIHRIKVWTLLGALRTTAVEIYGQNKRGTFDKIGGGESQHAEIFEFVNTRKRSICTNTINPRNITFVLFPTMGNLLKNCSVIKLVIRKTARCVPVLRKIEIWGEPARCCPESIRDAVNQMWYESTHEIISSVKEIENDVCQPNVTSIPEDLLDEITCEIMTIPMILPSGKAVDQRTIERHNQQEETWGRQPSDPFTGLVYTDTRKPIFNAALKSSIDQFLIKHSDSNKFQHLPRTVGSNFRATITGRTPHLHPIAKKRKLESESPELNLSCTSLEAAVRKALATTTRYTLPQVTIEPDTACHSCMKTLGSFYKINSCKHLICRDCLDFQTQNPSSSSCTCGVSFEKRSVEKYHIK